MDDAGGADPTLTGAAGAVPLEGLDERIGSSLDALLAALELEPAGADRFRVRGEPGRFPRLFGGQVVAQAALAAAATVEGKALHSIHASFVAAGAPDATLELAVDRVRDGRSFATRQVTARQGDRTLLVALCSFEAPAPTTVGVAPAAPPVPPPEATPVLQEWADAAAPAHQALSRGWVDLPPPLDLRIGEAPNFMGGPAAVDARSHWMRLPRPVRDDPTLHAVLLAYASDYFLLDMAVRGHPRADAVDPTATVSLDHAVWFHGPVRFDRWHLHTQELLALAGQRGLVRGTVHDADGALVATVVQETLVRTAPGAHPTPTRSEP